MYKQIKFAVFVSIASMLLSGCVVRTYQYTKDRVDQDLTEGNHGYIQGNRPETLENKNREPKRTFQAVEVELHSPLKFVKSKKSAPEASELITEEAGNRGYVNQSENAVEEKTEDYTVLRGDTLQKISQKIYGTTKKWNKIFELNVGSLKGPDKIYPGQVIRVPVRVMKETKENLK